MAKDPKMLAAISLVSECNACHAGFVKAGSEAVEFALQAGEILYRMKANVPRGEWEGFVSQYIKFSLRIAQHYMKLHKDLESLPKTTRASFLKHEGGVRGMMAAVSKASKTPSERKPKKSKKRRPAAKSEEPVTDDANTVDAESVSPSQPNLGACPNCKGTEWTDDGSGIACAKCSHPHGEPVGDDDPGEPEWKTQQKKTIKTIEALQRAFDDLHRMKKNHRQWQSVVNAKDSTCSQLLKIAREWDK